MDQDSSKIIVLRTTTGTCPVCVKMVPARVIETDGRLFIEKDCPEHGASRALLSASPKYFSELMTAYFELMPESLPQRDFIIRLTARCNMHCPICLASSDEYNESDYSAKDLQSFLTGRKRTKLDLMGAEATLHDDLEQIIRQASAQGHITALHTNGIRLLERDYFLRLLDAGLNEVHLQCDGFNDEHDLIIRGQAMNETKKKALALLEEFNVATDLVVTVLSGVNEKATGEMLDYAARHKFVTEVFYLGCRRLGRATEDFADSCLAPDELIDMLQEQTNGKINRSDIRVFQKLYFAMLALFKVRKCFYIHHYMVLRDNDRYRPISDYADFNYLEPRLDRFRKIFAKSKILAGGYLLFHGAISVLKRGGVALIYHGLILQILLYLGFDLSRISKKIILLGFITACDPWIYDSQVAANCGKGELSGDQGSQDSGAYANVMRELDHRAVDLKTQSIKKD